MAGAEIHLDPVPSSVPIARRWLREALEFDGRYNVAAACLLLSELVTNALLHARTSLTVRVKEEDGRLRVEVVDIGAGPWRLRDVSGGAGPSGDDESGRGLSIVATVARDWGVVPNGDGPGTTVWFELAQLDDVMVAGRDASTA